MTEPAVSTSYVCFAPYHFTGKELLVSKQHRVGDRLPLGSDVGFSPTNNSLSHYLRYFFLTPRIC
jgi:hypothetical protein